MVPSITELLSDLALDKEIVGITKFCIHPMLWHKTKTRTGGTKTVNLQRIVQLQPDLILANKEENTSSEVFYLAEHCNVLLTDITTLEDACNMIGDIGQLTGKQLFADHIINTISDGFKHIVPLSFPVKAAYFIWKDPYMVAGADTFIDTMMSYCGFENCFAHLKRYPEITVKDVTKHNCDVILLSSEPFPFAEKHLKQLRVEFPGIPIILVDGEMFSWYGSRLIKAPEYFQNLINSLR